MAAKSLIKQCLIGLDILGVDPVKQKSNFDVFKMFAAFAILLHLVMELTLQYIYNWKGWQAADTFPNYTAVLQACIKMFLIQIGGKKFKNLINKVEMFWNWDNFNEKCRRDIEKYTNITQKCINLFTLCMIFSFSTYALKPLITGDRSLPFDGYHPLNRSNTYSYAIMYTLHMIEGTYICFVLYGFDCLFLVLIMNVYCEIKKINLMISTVDVNGNVQSQIKYLIVHHNFILKYIKDMDAAYSHALLAQLSTSTMGVCVCLLAIVSDGFPPDLQHIGKYGPFTATAAIQLFLYCYLGTLLMEETTTVSKAVYQSKWWSKTQPEFRRACVLMILRSNKPEYLLATGMFRLNLESFTTIMKFAVSFLTLTVQLRMNHTA